LLLSVALLLLYLVQPGTDVMIFKLAISAQNKAKLFKNLIITLVFEKNAKFFDENWQKSQKIVIVTSTPGVTRSAELSNKSA
jgi:hypothetical protein